MYNGYWDDYHEVGQSEKQKNCLQAHYKVYKDGKLLHSGRYALKQCCSVSMKMKDSEHKRKNRLELIKMAGYIIKRKIWNVSKNCYQGDWIIV